MKEQKALFSYIFARRVFSGRLPDAEEAIYDNNTNQLQKWHLIQLKIVLRVMAIAQTPSAAHY